MTKRDNLLKTGGIIVFVVALVQLIVTIVGLIQSAEALQFIGAIAEAGGVGASYTGFMVGTIVMGFIIAAFYLIAGYLGFKGNSVKACKVIGIIILILGILGFIGAIGSIAVSPLTFVVSLIDFVAALLYVIGAFKSEQ